MTAGARIVVVAVALLAVAACGGGPSPEDRRRTSLLAADPVLDADIAGVVPLGPVSTVVGHGSGPTTTNSEAQRRFTSSMSTEDTVRAIVDVAESGGWTVNDVSASGTGWVALGRRQHDGFVALLSVIVLADQQATSATIVLSAQRALTD